jgi:hypothetical protein
VTARHRVLDNLSHRLDRAATIVPDVLDHLDEQRANTPVLAAQDTSRGYQSSGGISDPTLRTVTHLDQIEYKRQEIRDNIATLELAVRLLEQSCRRALSFRVADDQPDMLDSERDLFEQCIECEQIRVVRTARNGLTIDDGRCLDCGRTEDLVQYERAAQKLMQRINSGR